jgi:hypothetical protein
MSNNHRGDNAAPNASDVARDRRFESISLQQRPLQTCFLTREDSEKRTEIVDGGARRSYGHRKPLEEWQVLLKDHHVGICPPRYGCTRGPTMARTQPASLARAMGGGAHFADRVRASAKVTLAPNSARAAAGTKAELSFQWPRRCSRWNSLRIAPRETSGTEGSNPSSSSSESDANLIPEVVGLGRAIKHGDRIGANTPGVCRVAAADILTRRPARKAAFSARPGCRHPWRSPLGKHIYRIKVCWYRPCVGGRESECRKLAAASSRVPP